ncbi:MAG: ferredoxin [Candidatus Pacebacteria bacterium]|nr:ferredoxin [Candidatus Paceibacterota bacterium]
MKKVKVDKKTCIGCGACVALAPESFEMDEKGKSKPIDPAGDDQAVIQSAIDSCPVKAISWEEK